jgi:hypothetical protein
VWDGDVARFGVDIWMTTTAIADGFRVCEAFLGAKIHNAKDPGTDLAGMFVQVVSSAFELMRGHEDQWRRIEGTEPVPLFGFPHGVGLEPVEVNADRMRDIFLQACRDLPEVWEKALPADSLASLRALAREPHSPFAFPDDLWVRLVYDFAAAYARRALASDQLLRSLVPIYLGRTASFVTATRHSDAEEVEARIRALADEYVAQKAYLLRRWSQAP